MLRVEVSPMQVLHIIPIFSFDRADLTFVNLFFFYALYLFEKAPVPIGIHLGGAIEMIASSIALHGFQSLLSSG